MRFNCPCNERHGNIPELILPACRTESFQHRVYRCRLPFNETGILTYPFQHGSVGHYCLDHDYPSSSISMIFALLYFTYLPVSLFLVSPLHCGCLLPQRMHLTHRIFILIPKFTFYTIPYYTGNWSMITRSTSYMELKIATPHNRLLPFTGVLFGYEGELLSPIWG